MGWTFFQGLGAKAPVENTRDKLLYGADILFRDERKKKNVSKEIESVITDSDECYKEKQRWVMGWKKGQGFVLRIFVFLAFGRCLEKSGHSHICYIN